MDLLVCAYPLYLTHQYYSNQTETSNLPFLAVWWSAFGAITLSENYANIDSLPFYWMIKSGALISLYSSDYREWLQQNALSTVAIAGTKVKDTVVTIVDEHFPAMKQYIKLPSKEGRTESPMTGWFSWFGNSE